MKKVLIFLSVFCLTIFACQWLVKPCVVPMNHNIKPYAPPQTSTQQQDEEREREYQRIAEELRRRDAEGLRDVERI